MYKPLKVLKEMRQQIPRQKANIHWYITHLRVPRQWSKKAPDGSLPVDVP